MKNKKIKFSKKDIKKIADFHTLLIKMDQRQKRDNEYNYQPSELANIAVYHKNIFLYCLESWDHNMQIFVHYNLCLAFELSLKAVLVATDIMKGYYER